MQRRAPARGAADVSCTVSRRPDFADLSPLKQELEQLLRDSLAKLAGTVLPTPPAADAVVLERTREAQHGDFATNVALRLAKSARRNPRELAEAIVAALPASPLLGRAEVAGAGFINFHLTAAAYARELASLHAQAGAYGESRLGRGERVLVEFVSANPTGPLHVGHGRQAAYGATLANILAAVGFRIEREYDVNDAGRQMAIRGDLAEFGVVFDHWTSERALADSGAIDHALSVLEARGHLRREEGAVWFRATEFGDEKDRVVVRENGQRTYFASDIAYHLAKRERGFARLIDVLGADHHGYVARVRTGLIALGQPGECLEAPLIQFVNLYRGADKVPMGKREAQFVTLRQLREEVGSDACRFFYLMRSHDQPLDFDLELAKSRSNENPVYYIQYAHARVVSVMKQLAARGLAFEREAGLIAAERLASPHEQALLKSLTRYPEILEQAAVNRAPHTLAHYLRDLANEFHTYYNAEAFIVAEAPLRNARLALVLAAQQVLRNGLTLLGVSAPESM